MPIVVREALKVLLLNERDELLLLQAGDQRFHREPFWFLVGGKIEEGETLEATALREIYEEASLPAEAIELGPIVWYGEFTLVFDGVPTRYKERFMVARTTETVVSLDHLTPEEQLTVKKIAWFSLEQIENSEQVVYPVLLPRYLPDIIAKKYPKQPIKIDLTAKPKL